MTTEEVLSDEINILVQLAKEMSKELEVDMPYQEKVFLEEDFYEVQIMKAYLSRRLASVRNGKG